jgi:hypothetical protein
MAALAAGWAACGGALAQDEEEKPYKGIIERLDVIQTTDGQTDEIYLKVWVDNDMSSRHFIRIPESGATDVSNGEKLVLDRTFSYAHQIDIEVWDEDGGFRGADDRIGYFQITPDGGDQMYADTKILTGDGANVRASWRSLSEPAFLTRGFWTFLDASIAATVEKHPRVDVSWPYGKAPRDVVGMAYYKRPAEKAGLIYAYYKDGTYSRSRSSQDLRNVTDTGTYRLPPGKTYADIVAMAWHKGSHQRLYTWYDDMTYSVGTVTDLGRYEVGKPFVYEGSNSIVPRRIIDTAIHALSGGDPIVFTWFDTGRVVVGRPGDLTAGSRSDEYVAQPWRNDGANVFGFYEGEGDRTVRFQNFTLDRRLSQNDLCIVGVVNSDDGLFFYFDNPEKSAAMWNSKC